MFEMQLISSFLLAFSVLVSHTLAASLPEISVSKGDGNSSWLLPVPTQDPWYKPPKGWESAAPGKALSVRYSPYRNISIAECIDTFQILYRTQDTNNNASWAVTTLFIPASHATCSTNPETCSHAAVTYALPYDTVYKDATPSYLLQYSEPYGEMFELLRRGWFVNAPDYEGPLASYCAGVQSGHATLDSMIAVNEVGYLVGLQNSTLRQAIWGYSGGAMAAEYSAELAAKYSPNLKIAGIVAGGLIPNITSAGNKLTGADTAGLAVAGILGITSQHPDARTYLNSQLRKNGTYNITGFYGAEYDTGSDVLTAFANQNVYDYFINGSQSLDNQLLDQIYYDDATMGHKGIPNMPMFIYKAINDEMSAAPETDKLVDQFCANGSNILYHRNAAGGHNQELWQGHSRVFSYLSRVLDGKPDPGYTGSPAYVGLEIPTSGCLIQTLTYTVAVTIENTTVVQGPVSKNYTQIFTEPAAYVVYPNGTYLVPYNGSTITVPPNKRWEMSRSHLVKRGVKSLSSMWRRGETRMAQKLDMIGALKSVTEADSRH